MLLQLPRVALSSPLGPQLALHAVDTLGGDPGGSEQRLVCEPVVALLVVRSDTALVGEPHLDALPAGLADPGRPVARQQFVGARRRAAAAQRQVRDAALAAGALQASHDLQGRALGHSLGVGECRQPRHSVSSVIRSPPSRASPSRASPSWAPPPWTPPPRAASPGRLAMPAGRWGRAAMPA